MHKLLGEERKDETTVNTKVFPTFRKLADQFLDNSIRVSKETTIRMHKMYLQSFCDHVKKKRIDDLRVHHVTEWIVGTGWGQSTACSARGTVLAVLNWAVEQVVVPASPAGITTGREPAAWMRQEGLTDAQLAIHLGVSRPCVAQYRTGTRTMGKAFLGRLARYATHPASGGCNHSLTSGGAGVTSRSPGVAEPTCGSAGISST